MSSVVVDRAYHHATRPWECGFQRSAAKIARVVAGFEILHFSGTAGRDPFGEATEFGKVVNGGDADKVKACNGCSFLDEFRDEVFLLQTSIIAGRILIRTSLATILDVEIIGLLFLEAILMLGAIALGAASAFIVAYATKGAVRGRRLTILIASFLPFVIFVCLGGGVLAYGFAERALGKDNFLDGQYHYSLANGYQLAMFDKFPDHLYIEHVSRPYDGVDNVRAVQVAGSVLLLSAYRGENVSD
jgi:hypothetical protein